MRRRCLLSCLAQTNAAESYHAAPHPQQCSRADRLLNTDHVQYFDRYQRRLEREQIYGESYLRWIYGNPLGKLALNALVKRAAFSRWYGWRMNRPASRSKILPFIQHYGLETHEFLEEPTRYQTFNEFFYRRLKPQARPIHADPHSVVFPADGRHLGFADISRIEGVFVKGERFDFAELLGDPALAACYAKGSLVISRLCPVDYHRFHFPIAGIPSATTLLPGSLQSVNPIALRRNIHILAQNRRWLTRVTNADIGEVLLLEVGATNVGSAIGTYTPGKRVEKGEEKGYFQFGGSLTMCLFPPGGLELDSDLLEQTAAGVELYAKMGDRMGEYGNVLRTTRTRTPVS